MSIENVGKLVKQSVDTHQHEIKRALSALNLAIFSAAHSYPDADFGVDVNRSDQHNIVEIVVRMKRTPTADEIAAEDEHRAMQEKKQADEIAKDRDKAIRHQIELDKAKGIEPDMVGLLTEEWANSSKSMRLKEYLAVRMKQLEEG